MDTESRELYALNLAGFSEAQKLLASRALRKAREVFGPHHPSIPQCLLKLARHYEGQGHSPYAEILFRLAVGLLERLPNSQVEMVQTLIAVGRFYYAQGRYSAAQVYFTRAITMDEEAFWESQKGGLVNLTELAQAYVFHKACADRMCRRDSTR